MYLAQVAAFLWHHHHHYWATHLATARPKLQARWIHWAIRHGFRYQP